MSRRRASKKRELLPDPVYGSTIVAKLINYVMYGGSKSIAEKIVYSALDRLAKGSKKKPLEALDDVLTNLKPSVEVRSRRIGGSTYQIPVEVRQERSLALALRWMVVNSRSRHEKTMVDKLGAEMVDAFNAKGGSFKKKEDIQKMAEANRAFAHYRW